MSVNSAEVPVQKVCKVCEEVLPLEQFNKKSRQCKKCQYAKNKKYFKEYYAKNKHHRGVSPELVDDHASDEKSISEEDEENKALWDTLLLIVETLKERLLKE